MQTDIHTYNKLQFYGLLSFATVLILGTYLRYVYMLGAFMAEDEISYMSRVVEILGGNLDPSTFGFADYRFLIYLPQSIINYFIGFSPFSVVLWPFLASIMHIFVVYKIGVIVFDDVPSAVLAALFMAIAPLNVLEIRLLPDAIFSFFISLSIFFLLKSNLALSTKATYYNLAYCSFFVVCSFLVRENAFLVFPFFAMFVSFHAKNRRAYIIFFSIFIIFICILSVFLSMFPIVSPYDKVVKMWLLFHLPTVSKYLNHIKHFPYYNYLYHPITIGYGMAIIFFVGSIYLNHIKDKATNPIFLWFITVYIYFEFLSPLHGLRPAEGSFRYLTPFMAPMALLIGRFIKKMVFTLPLNRDVEVYNRLTVLTIFISLILQQLYGNLSLLPIFLFFVFGKHSCGRISMHLLGAPRYKSFNGQFNVMGFALISMTIAGTFFYMTTASHAYKKVTLNNVIEEIYSDLAHQDAGIIASNDLIAERKLNLYRNGEIITRSMDNSKLYKYIVLINEKLLKLSYSKVSPNNGYNKDLYARIDRGNYLKISNKMNYKIYKKNNTP